MAYCTVLYVCSRTHPWDTVKLLGEAHAFSVYPSIDRQLPAFTFTIRVIRPSASAPTPHCSQLKAPLAAECACCASATRSKPTCRLLALGGLAPDCCLAVPSPRAHELHKN